jgi:hypothetical protein
MVQRHTAKKILESNYSYIIVEDNIDYNIFFQDCATLRRNLLIDMLTYKGNTYRFNMHGNIQEYIDRIMEKID